MVLFQQTITFDENEIPQKIKRYFSVADNNNCIAKITDRNSAQLVLSDNEIGKILVALDVRDENLYDEAQEPETHDAQPQIPNAAERLELVRKTLANVTAKTPIKKLIVYYQTLINLERQKEPTVQEGHPFHINWANIANSININLEHSPAFHQLFQQNRTQQFPKNVFIGVNVLLNNQNLPLLYAIIPNRDILSHTSIEIPIEDFTLFTKPLEDRNYPDELLEELASAVNQKNTITEKIEVLRSYLDDVVELVENITLAFSEENPFTSQLLSELKKINSENLVKENSLLEKFLLKKEIPNTIQGIPASEFIQISPLNSKQKEAVRFAFNQPLSVVTGPPGTGKTQVVLNILANAILHNKKVLLASKNNQAVDNVKDRLTALIREPKFFLRFGSKTEIRDRTKPTIDFFVRQKHNNVLDDNSDKLAQVENEIREKKTIIANCNAQLERKRKLEKDVVCQIQLLELQETNYETFLNTNESLSVFEAQTKQSLNSLKAENIKSRSEISSKYSGIQKVLFDLFSKKKFAVSLISSFESWPPELRQLAENQNIKPSLATLTNGETIISSYSKLVQFLEKGVSFIDKKIELGQNVQKAKDLLNNMQLELQRLSENEENLKTEIANTQNAVDSLGASLLNELIHKKIRISDAAQINKYKEYVPDNIPWQWGEIPEFIKTTKNFLDTFNISAITSLSIKSAFPLADELFDIVVIDEASQCDVASALPLILRAKQLVVIGDPMQLKHISKVQAYEEKYIQNNLGIDANLRLDYVSESLYDYCYNLSITSKSHSVFLKEHFRCHPQIINYSNKAFYGPKMGQELDILTTPENYQIEPKGIFWVNTKGTQHEQRNSNKLELDKAISLACKLAEQHPNISIGITTPFRHQANELKEAIPTSLRERIKADAVHSFQGDEKDIMIFSLVVSQNSPRHKAEWINAKVPYLINVAVTRAKNTLYIVGNANYCKSLPSDSPLGLLVNYVDEINPIQN